MAINLNMLIAFMHKTQSSQLKSIEREMLNQVDVIKSLFIRGS